MSTCTRKDVILYQSSRVLISRESLQSTVQSRFVCTCAFLGVHVPSEHIKTDTADTPYSAVPFHIFLSRNLINQVKLQWEAEGDGNCECRLDQSIIHEFNAHARSLISRILWL
jgi:hypothetical protein